MTGTDLCVNKCKQSRSYLNHLVYIMLYFIYIVSLCYIWISVKSALFRNTKSKFLSDNALYNILQNTPQMNTFLENASFQTTAFQQKQHLNVVTCHMSFSGLICMFVFEILKIPSECTQNWGGSIAPTWKLLVTGLDGACDTYGRRESCIQDFDGKTWVNDLGLDGRTIPKWINEKLVGFRGLDWSVSGYGHVTRFFECGNELSGSMRAYE